MFNIDENGALLKTASLRDFLNLMEAYFRTNLINRYMYIFLPAECRFEPNMIEFYHYGYDEIPEVVQHNSIFMRSAKGARFCKIVTEGSLIPFNEESEIWKADLIQENDIYFSDPDENEESLYVPVHAGGMQTGLFFLRGEKETAKFFDNTRTTQGICQTLHQRYCELWAPRNRAIEFTVREREIINWVAQGKSNAVIGDIEGLSKHTVDAHLRAIFLKLSVSSRTAAAVKASALGLLKP